MNSLDWQGLQHYHNLLSGRTRCAPSEAVVIAPSKDVGNRTQCAPSEGVVIAPSKDVGNRTQCAPSEGVVIAPSKDVGNRTQCAPSDYVVITPRECVVIALSEDIVRFTLQQLHVAGGQTQCCLTAAQRDSVLLLLTLVMVVFSKDSWKSGTHSTGKQRQEARGYLVRIFRTLSMYVRSHV